MPFRLRTEHTPSGVSRLAAIESVVGALFALVFGVYVILASIFYSLARVFDEKYVRSRWVTFIYLLIFAGEAIFVYRLLKSLEDGLHPIGPQLALRQRRIPFIFQPVIVIWWLAHYLVALMTLIHLEREFSFDDLPMHSLIAWGSLYLAVIFMLMNSATIYLLLSVASIRSSKALISRIWKLRIFLDLAVTLGTAIVTFRYGVWFDKCLDQLQNYVRLNL